MDVGTSRLRKESAIPLDQCSLPTPEIRITADEIYPFALVLRLRVLQIVCGITSLIMGTVALIEVRGEINLGLGMPAGVVTVIAAGASIHTSRGFSGYKEPNCNSKLRFLGPRLSVAVPMTFLWFVACMLQVVLSGACLRELAFFPSNTQMSVLASLLLALSLLTLTAVFVLLRIDCHYDPD
ncbi:uncharacterized protein LOC112127581 isoform X2 [Cimex lectularius]|nr:uncharacterized protein LOC112127581 isoform X2 [Cimex lectularius]XP_024084480.1 uncharacterized protein LOC112127581 isoform X2 [Cimex lectularius]